MIDSTSTTVKNIDLSAYNDTSALNQVKERTDRIATLPWFVWLMLMPYSITSDIQVQEPISTNTVTSINTLTPSLSSAADIVYSFISKLIANGEDLDGRIVDMVNEDFWDLI